MRKREKKRETDEGRADRTTRRRHGCGGVEKKRRSRDRESRPDEEAVPRKVREINKGRIVWVHVGGAGGGEHI